MRHFWPISFRRRGLQKNVVFGFLLSSAIAVGMSVAANRTAVGLIKAQDQIFRTHTVLASLERVFSSVKDVGTGGWGYLAFGQENYLEPYYAGKAVINQELRGLEDLVAGNPSQHQRVELLKQLIRSKVSITERRVEARRQQGAKAALEVLPVGEGKEAMDRIRAVVQQMEEEAQKGLAQESRRNQTQSQRIVLASFVVPIVNIAILVAVYYLINQEINQRKQAEAVLQESEERFSAFMNNSATVAFMKTAAGRYIYVNQSFEQFFHKTLDEVRGLTDFEIWPHKVAAALRENDLAVWRKGETSQSVEMLPTPGGHPHYWLTFKFTIQSSQEYLGGVAIDINERILAEEALRLRDRAIAAASDGIVLAGPPDSDNPITYVNPAFCAMTGYTVTESLGCNFLSFIGRNTDQAVIAQIGHCLEAKTSCQAILLTYHRNGETFWYELTITPTPDTGGQVVSFIGVMRDVTERKRVEEQLRLFESAVKTERKRAEEQLRLFKSAVYYADDSILITNAELTHPGPEIIFVNPSFTRMTGYSDNEVVGKTLHILQAPKTNQGIIDRLHEKSLHILQGPKTDRDLINRLCENHKKGEIFLGEVINYRKDGTELSLEWSIAPILNEDGETTHYVVVQRDTTERKQAEAELKQFATKLQQSNNQLEEFAYIASHDLQEPLRKIQSFGDRLKAKCSDQLGDQGNQYLSRMQNAAWRMSTLIENLLSFSRITTKAQPFLPVDLNQIVREVLSDLEVRIEQLDGQVLVGDLPTLDADPLQMRQLMQNLIGNALKFHRPLVAPIVQVSAVVDRPARDPSHALGGFPPKTAVSGALRDSPPCTSAPVVKLTVIDNGIGFDPQYAERIFNLFERLHGRDTYEGTGLGLAICQKIVERHGGKIKAESRPEGGSQFEIDLPLHTHDSEPTPDA